MNHFSVAPKERDRIMLELATPAEKELMEYVDVYVHVQIPRIVAAFALITEIQRTHAKLNGLPDPHDPDQRTFLEEIIMSAFKTELGEPGDRNEHIYLIYDVFKQVIEDGIFDHWKEVKQI